MHKLEEDAIDFIKHGPGIVDVERRCSSVTHRERELIMTPQLRALTALNTKQPLWPTCTRDATELKSVEDAWFALRNINMLGECAVDIATAFKTSVDRSSYIGELASNIAHAIDLFKNVKTAIGSVHDELKEFAPLIHRDAGGDVDVYKILCNVFRKAYTTYSLRRQQQP
jgi:hypothetical protein